MAQHQGIGGYGYCVECGQKPGNTTFDPKKCQPKGEWKRK